MEKRQRRMFTDEFKAQTVELVRKSGKTVTEVAHPSSGRLSARLLDRRNGVRRQLDAEDAALPSKVAYVNGAVVRLDRPLHDSQAEPEARPVLPHLRVGLEQLVDHLL